MQPLSPPTSPEIGQNSNPLVPRSTSGWFKGTTACAPAHKKDITEVASPASPTLQVSAPQLLGQGSRDPEKGAQETQLLHSTSPEATAFPPKAAASTTASAGLAGPAPPRTAVVSGPHHPARIPLSPQQHPTQSGHHLKPPSQYHDLYIQEEMTPNPDDIHWVEVRL